jgi:hypothetical protein
MQHASDASIEAYAWFRLKSPGLEQLEEHLLICEGCRMRVSAEDRVREMFLLDLTRHRLGDEPIRQPVGKPAVSPVIMID